jgi:hypothetical protein
MELDVVLWGLGIVIAILLAFLGIKKVVRQRTQTAKATKNSTVIQSGRDTSLK